MIKPSGGMMRQGEREEIQAHGVIGDLVLLHTLGDMQEFIKMIVCIISRETGAIGSPWPFKLGWHSSSIVRRSGAGTLEVKKASTPIETQKPLLNDEDSEEVDVNMYKSMIGSLIRDGFKVTAGYANNEGKEILEEHWKEVFYEWALKNQENRNKESSKRSMPVETPASLALVSCDDIFDYEEIDGGYVAFGGNPKGGKITGKDTIKIVAFLLKPTESEGFVQTADFLNANPIKYALTVNPTLYTSSIEQFWAIIKAKTVNMEGQLQALVDGKKVLITESTIRRDLQLENAEGVDCLPNVVIFKQLTLMGYMKRVGKGFSVRGTHLFLTMIIQAQEDMGEGFDSPTDPHHTPIIIQPSTYQLQNTKQHRKPRRKDTELPQTSVTTSVADKAVNEEMNDSLEKAITTSTSLDAEQDKGNIFKTQSKATPNEPGSQGTSLGGGPSGEDSLKLTKLMELCIKLQQRVLNSETTKTTQALEIDSLKRRVKKFERIKRSRSLGLKRYTRTHDEQMFDVDQDLGGEEEQRLVGERAQQELEANIALIESWDDVQAKIDADYQLAKRLQAEEQKELNDEEKAKLFMKLLEKRRKLFAAKRAEEKTNKPPTQAQKRK
nr:hypothetical protein [Tanacetum cinerariifolium]